MNSTNFTIIDQLFSRTLNYTVAIFISVVGFAGLTCNWLVAYVKIVHRKQYNGVTYAFMSQLAIADGIVLFAVAFCASVFILWPDIQSDLIVIEQIFGFILNLGWFPGCFFIIIIAFSRFLALCKNDQMNTFFPKRVVKICTIVPWTAAILFFSSQLYYPRHWFPDKLSWGIDIMGNGNLGKVFMFILMINDFSTLSMVVFFNSQTLIWLYKKRKQVQNIDQTPMMKREIKLFLQCFISGCCFFGIIGPFTVLNLVTAGSQHSIFLYLGMDMMWIFHHTLNPYIYVILNRKLRSHIISLLTCKMYGPGKEFSGGKTVASTNTRMAR
uniref:G-protein coupled receptors family 1 profile domain-containing protein n=1 Tax=Romanomermis culicivorax TaxID=13658 RepID=A0A915KZ63_ROMCU